MKIFKKNPENYKDKIFSHKLKVLYRRVLITVLIIAAIIFVKIYLDNQIYSQYEIQSTSDRVGTNDSEFEQYQTDLLVYSRDGISAYNAKGNQLWNQTYEMQKPIVKRNGQYVVCADYKGSHFYLMNKEKKIADVEMNMPVLDIQVSAQGYVLVQLQSDEGIFLKFYNRSGELVSEIKTTMQQSGYPLASAISPDNIKVAVSYVKTDTGKISTSLAFYNFGDVGQNATDNLVSGYNYDGEMYPVILYPTENRAVIIGDKKVLIAKGKQKPVIDEEKELDAQVQAVFYGEDAFVLAVDNPDEPGHYFVRQYDLNGKLELEHSIDFMYKDILVEKNRLIIYNEARVVIVSLNGTVKYDGDMGGSIETVIPLDKRNKFMVVREQGIDVVKLR